MERFSNPEYFRDAIKDDLDDLLYDLDADTLELEYFTTGGRDINTIKICGIMKDQDEYEHTAYYHWIDDRRHIIPYKIYEDMKNRAVYEMNNRIYGTYYEKEDVY